ncbi:hypothetical protein PP747_gp042 [Rhizobium phage RHph_Y38]|uniref:Uncharacterized protein n=1 Tax=Rhizobium phage RHph_Y38 TaxID=2509781 RepID=A0A7S5US17_9CAUD|nr:hypothetical protein PP747_gp042 [Rhizobium phage RHph_Y38]QIG67743.1 hypothetical protein EVB52_042 [Rhizobium phage RHph_Y38]
MVDTIDVKDANSVTRTVATNDAVKSSVDTAKTSIDTVNTSVGLVKTAVDAVKTSVDALKTVTSLGSKTAANSASVVIASDQTVPVNQASVAHEATASITRPTDVTPYTALDVLGDATAGHGKLTFANVNKAGGGSIIITGVTARFDNNVAPASAFRLHLYSSLPAGTALADNVAFDLPSTDRDAYLGWVDIPAPSLLGSTAVAQAINVGLQVKLTGTDIYGYMQTITGYTPGNGITYKFTMRTLEV